jgi:hypothetical protein
MRNTRNCSDESADDIVGLEAGEFEDGNAIGFEGTANVGNLLGKVLGRGSAIGFVSLVFDFSEGSGFDVELADGCNGFGLGKDGSEIGGGEIFAQFAQHVDEDVGRGGGKFRIWWTSSIGAPWRDTPGSIDTR